MKTPTNRILADYLRRLRRELRGVPATRRREILEELQAHIADARVEAGGLDEAAARTLVDRLGDPEEIAAEARAGTGSTRPAGFEVAAVILLLAGGFAAGVGWLAGLVMLWTSDAWSLRDKVLGTLVVPGGLAGALYLLMFAYLGSGQVVICSPDENDCTGSATTFGDVLLLAGSMLLLVAPFFTAWWLIRHARRPVPAVALA
jgi:uncharacterized membrane protein